MNIIPIEFVIARSELESLTAEEVELAIKEEILKSVIEAIAPMLDDENFIDITPSEDNSDVTVKVNLMLGSTMKYIDATSKLTNNLMQLCKSHNVSEENAADIIRDVTRPLIDLIS